jgi:TolB-like protein
MFKPLLAFALFGCLPACASAVPPEPGVSPPPAEVRVQAAPTTGASVPAQDRPGIAVLPFLNGGSYGRDAEDLAAMQVGIQQMLITELHQNTSLRVVERSALAAMKEEVDLSASGRVDPATAVRIGQLVGARYFIKGAFMDLGGNFRLDGHIVDTETGEYVKAVSVQTRGRENLYTLLVRLAAEITNGVELPPLARAAQEERLARNVPDEATVLYSRALVFAENGATEEAIELYRQIVQRFPDYTEAREELRQLEEEG